MTVGFFTVFRKDPLHYILADILVRSVRAAMPDVEIVQFSDETSPQVPDTARIIRKPHGKMLERRMEHYASSEGEWLLVDTDCVVQCDVRAVFDDPGFDVAIADREWSLVKDHHKYTKTMPYNTGVVFTRTPAFYARALEIWRTYPDDKKAQWYSEQWAVADAAAEARFRVKVLPGMVYNRPPATLQEDVSNASILHYKGDERKRWMLQRYAQKRGYEAAQ